MEISLDSIFEELKVETKRLAQCSDRLARLATAMDDKYMKNTPSIILIQNLAVIERLEELYDKTYANIMTLKKLAKLYDT